MAAEWYYRKNGQQLGPLEAAELKRLADSGAVLPDDLVWRQGAKQWAKASSVKGLFASASGDAVASPAPSPADTSPSGSTKSPTSSDDDWWSKTSSTDQEEDSSLPSRYSDDGIPYSRSSANRRQSKRRDFPALRATIVIVRVFALLALLIAGLCGIIAIQNGTAEEYAVMVTAIGFLVAFAMVSLLYFAAAECIALALYLTTVLEDIREK